MTLAAVEDEGTPGTFTADGKEALALLKLIWGDVCQIGHYGEGGYWWAARRDTIDAIFTADSVGDLNAAIRADYMARPVRRFPTGGCCVMACSHVYTTQEVTMNGKPVMVRMHVKCGATE